MSTNMTGGADGGIAIQVRLDTSKASKELNRLEQKILKLQEEVTVGKAKKSALVAQLEQANAELTALQAKTKIDGKSFVMLFYRGNPYSPAIDATFPSPERERQRVCC